LNVIQLRINASLIAGICAVAAGFLQKDALPSAERTTLASLLLGVAVLAAIGAYFVEFDSLDRTGVAFLGVLVAAPFTLTGAWLQHGPYRSGALLLFAMAGLWACIAAVVALRHWRRGRT